MARYRGKRPIQDGESLADFPFPLRGLDVSTEFELQPDETTPTGLNVRSYEPGTQRGRGGSRPGLVRYVPLQVSDTHLIQDLDFVVSSAESALSTGFDPLDGGGSGGVQDPSTNNGGLRNPGRFVRTGGSGIQLNRNAFTVGKLTPRLTAKNQTKLFGTNFYFQGTEFTQTGLLPGDAYTVATLTSAGAVASAAVGNYQIAIANPIPNTSLSVHQSQGKYNPAVLVFGNMSVSPQVPIAKILSILGGHSNLDFRDFPFSSGIVAGPFLGYTNWRIIQYLKATGFPTSTISESGTVDPSGMPTSVLNPAHNIYSAVAGPISTAIDYSSQIRFEVSLDGTNWPTPPIL